MKAPANAPLFAATYPALAAFCFDYTKPDNITKLVGGEAFDREIAKLLGIEYSSLVRAMWDRDSKNNDKEIEADFVALRKLMRRKADAAAFVDCPIYPFNGETEQKQVRVYNVADTKVVRVDFSWYSYCYTSRANLGVNTFADVDLLNMEGVCDENGRPKFWVD
jgi:hypothetical protein